MKAAFFGTWNRGHSANRIAAAAVRSAGFDVVEIHEPLWERTRDKHAGYFAPWSLARLGLQWLGAAARLVATWRRTGGAPVAVVGFNGQLDVLLLRLAAWRHGPRIVFAPLVSLTETLVVDRGVYRAGSVAARLLAALDRWTAAAADVVVVDTHEHLRYFHEELGVARSRLQVCHLGADPEVFLEPLPAPPVPEAGRPLDVLWFGQYLPLHGLDVIVDAVGRLAMRDGIRGRVVFTFLGTGEDRFRVETAARATRADVRFVDWVPYEDLAGRIAAADVVLGVFGSSAKARMVVANKVYEAAAVGRPVVTADTPAMREVFEEGREVVLCRADGASLADAIASLCDPQQGEVRRLEIGRAARRRMQEAFSREALGRAWSVPLAGPGAGNVARAAASPRPRVGVAVLCFQDAARTLACLHSVAGDGYGDLDVLVVDNASVEIEARRLAEGLEGGLAVATRGRGAAGADAHAAVRADAHASDGQAAREGVGEERVVRVELVRLERNLGYAGANNLAMRTLFGRGCEHVLLLNSDTVLAPGSIEALVEAAASPRVGPVGPRVSRGRPGNAPASLGERYASAWLWAPRSLLRVRARRQVPYGVGGVLGCAMMVPRALWEAVGGFDESLFAYYEEVDLCLRARAAGWKPTVAPGADVGHDGSRGFASGMTPLSAWLKARNLLRVGRAHTGDAGRRLLELGSHLLVAASAAGYALRGRGDVASALFAGLAAGREGAGGDDAGGEPPAWLFVASGYGGSGFAERSRGAAAPGPAPAAQGTAPAAGGRPSRDAMPDHEGERP